ncbi:helix-turn-helix domain-containing protein [Flavivirga spongiicola]|uniref:AraC family transcriptional regulator n=1 Tax=Flavivirga spongiicola TaxID=421621 RepID=A0ABU7XYX2_9FLAO|nr:AraC family transcriptional regulator [Flavivirga sp. MEBiC05379]MDO5980995.1 AraC family transcriptional regulator [Flavivirga sp. MEBiC05379]
MIVFIFIISFLQGAIFGLIVLFSKFYRSDINKYLAYTILTVSSIGLMNGVEDYFDNSNLFFYALLDNIPLEVLFPATFLTFVSLKTSIKRLKGKHVFLYIPFYLFSIINIMIVTLDAVGLIYDSNIRSFIYILFDIEYYFILIYSIFGGAFCLVFISNAKHLEEKSRKWLKYLTIVYFALILMWVFMELYSILTDKDSLYTEYVLWIGVTTFFYWMSYKGLIRFKLLDDRYEITQIIQSSLPKEKKETKKDISNIHFQKLETLMLDNHAYLDADLSREYMANQIGISPGYLSKIINDITNDNFSGYVNAYRVDVVKSMMANPEFDKYSLLAIGYESGFISKTGFYNAFKKYTGMTPNAYKTKINKS